jgi:UDPglucose--hexose-1-phosphate uridylyltransferase
MHQQKSILNCIENSMLSELRKDYIQNKVVIIAPRRGKRPHDTITKLPNIASDNTKCVFCPHNQKGIQAKCINGTDANWSLKIIDNIYPAVQLANKKAYGVQEVIIETPQHNVELHELPQENIEALLRAYASRTKQIAKIKNIEYILIFKNAGAEAGASLKHAHSQIFATDFLPPHLFDKSQRIDAYQVQRGRCVYCDVIKEEVKKKVRMVYSDKHNVAFTPYASMHNYELWIMPHRHLDNITMLNKNETKSFAKILKRALKKIHALDLPYNFYFHQVVFDKDQHLYMKLTPRGSKWAGVEIGSGVIINPVSPEDAAEYYRGDN